MYVFQIIFNLVNSIGICFPRSLYGYIFSYLRCKIKIPALKGITRARGNRRSCQASLLYGLTSDRSSSGSHKSDGVRGQSANYNGIALACGAVCNQYVKDVISNFKRGNLVVNSILEFFIGCHDIRRAGCNRNVIHKRERRHRIAERSAYFFICYG